MKRELGIARCGLACCLCSENTVCKGCKQDGFLALPWCPDADWCENRRCVIEKKLDGYLAKVGISEGLFGFTFNEDGTMAVQYGSRSFPGTWTLDTEKATINMKMASFINMKGYAAVKNGKMELLFDATTMMKIVKSVTSVYKNSTLTTINSILNQYDQMYAGFKLTK